MYKVGLSSCGFALTEDNFRKLEQSGITSIEISLSPDQYRLINYKEVSEFSKRYHIALWSYHLPFSPFKEIEISSTNSELRKSTIEYYTQLIEKATDIGIDKFIVHPSGEPIAPSFREERMQYSMQSLDVLAEIARKHGAIIAVEDLPRSCLGNSSNEILRLIDVNDKLKVCFDTNHLLGENNLSFMEKIGDRIVTLHVSDYDFIDEKHWLPGEGLIEWQELLVMLQKIDYRGIWLYELGLQSPKTLMRSRDLTFNDFRNNADEIFAGKKPTSLL